MPTEDELALMQWEDDGSPPAKDPEHNLNDYAAGYAPTDASLQSGRSGIPRGRVGGKTLAGAALAAVQWMREVFR